MSKDLQMKIRPTPANLAYNRRNLKGPTFAPESFTQNMTAQNQLGMINQGIF